MLSIVKGSGGTVFAQSSDDALYPDMPRAAIATGFVDLVVSSEHVAQLLCRFLSTRDMETDLSS